MKYKFITLLLVLCSGRLVYGQNDGEPLLIQADSIFQLGLYQQAIPVYQETSQVFLEREDWSRYLTALNQMCESHWRLFDLETAQILADSVISVIEKHDKKEEDKFQLLKATAFFHLGVISNYKSKLHDAIRWMEASVEIRENLLESNHPDLLRVYNGLGATYVVLQEPDLAQNYLDKVVEAAPNSPGPARMNRANLYNLRGDFHRAIDELQTVLEIHRSNYPEGHPALLEVYTNLSVVYSLTRDFEKAFEFVQASIEGKKKLYGDSFPELHQDYSMLAYFNYSYADYERAIYYENKGIDLIIDFNPDGRYDGDLARAYSNLSATYLKLEQYDSAFFFSLKAEELFHRIQDPLNQALSHHIIGEIYQFRDQPEQALEFYESALDKCLMYLGVNHAVTAASYYKLAHFYEEEEDFAKSIYYINKSIESSITYTPAHDSGYSIQNVPIPSDLIAYLDIKAVTYVRQYEKSDSVIYLNSALEVIESALSFTKEYRYYYQRYEDKFKYGSEIQAIYLSAMETSHLLYQKTGDMAYLDKAFQFLEQSKSQVLEYHLLDKEAKKYSGIEEEVLLAENQINSDWTYYQSELLNLKSQKEGYDTSRFIRIREKLAWTNQRKDSINSYLEENHEEYFNLKYRDITTSVEKFQRKLAPDQAFLNYLKTDSTLQVLVLTKDSREWIRLANDTTLLQTRDDFINALSFPGNRDFESLIGEFLLSSTQLYEYLLGPVLTNLSDDINRLIISPTDDFSSVPWELFVNPDGTETDDFASLNYLLKDYSVCYANSASLFQYGLNQKKEFGNNLLAFAPSYAGASPEHYALRNSFRDEYYDLEWNDQEVERIGMHFESDMRIGNQATEAYFKEQASNHRILHLAMHGYVDHEEPMQSKLLFFRDSLVSTTDSLADDGILYAYELFDMDLGAEMTVLSACNTGLGKTRVGEGVMSLARAFLYAGCPSVVMSHWSVDDQATSKLIATFYKYLADGTSKDQALRNAKLTYLNEANGPYAHPFYWGAFVLNGDPDPLTGDNSLIWIFVIGGGAILVTFLLIRSRRL